MGDIIIPIFNFIVLTNAPVVMGDLVLNVGELELQVEGRESQKLKVMLAELPESESEDKIKYFQENRDKLRKIVALLRLYKEGNAYADRIIKNNEIVDHLPHFTAWDGETRLGFCRPTIIDESELEEFSIFWSAHIDLNIYDFAVSRFVYADFEPYDNEMFMRYVSCLEYLFVPDGDKGEIKYKFCSRISLFSSHDLSPEYRSLMFDELSVIYDIRSGLTHGKKTKGAAKDYLGELRCLCRNWIRYFYSAGVLEDRKRRMELIKKVTIYTPKICLNNN